MFITYNSQYDPRDQRANKQEHATLEEAQQRVQILGSHYVIRTRSKINPGQLVPVEVQA